MSDRVPEPKNQPKANGSRRPVQIMAEINRTRDEMDETLSAIERRLTPGQLVDQGLDYLRHSGAREYASNLAASVKTNPLPATLAGIGIAWLMAVGNRRDPQPASGGTDMGEKMQLAKQTLQDTKQKITGSVQSAKQSVSGGIDNARQSYEHILNENPLVLGAVGLAIGAVAAALAPRTQKEDEIMGDTRDKFIDQAKQAALDAARRETQTSGLTPNQSTNMKPQETTRPFPAPSAEEKMDDATKWPASAPRR